MNDLQLAATDPIKEKDSTFTAYAVKAKSVVEVRRAYHRVKLYQPEADHTVMAYATRSFAGGHDDHEFRAALRLQNLLQFHGESEMVIFIARRFGGQLLGPR